MAENNYIKIGGRLESTAEPTDPKNRHIVAGSTAIYDDDLTMKQNEINAQFAEIRDAVNNFNTDQSEALLLSSKVNNNEAKLGYYECTSGASDNPKIISSSSYSLSSGGSIKIKFVHANTLAPTVESPITLKIGTQEAKPLYYEGVAVDASNTWEDNETVDVYYDGNGYYANNVAGGSSDGVFDVSAKYPISGVEGGNTYTLELALSVLDANLSANKKEGGMQIRFVDSSDNKYVQYRLMSNDWSTNTEDWAIADEGVYVENPEYVYVKTDKEGKILWAIRTDGGIYYGAGCPQQVIDYIEKKIANLSLDEYEDIVTFLSDYLGSDTTLKVMIDGINASKVDKEDGKSLIDSEYADGVHYIENPEFVDVKVDSDGRILESIRVNGTKLLPSGVEVNDKIDFDGNETTIIENPEFVELKLDGAGHILWGIQKDGNVYFGAGCPQQVIDYIEEKISSLSLDEYEDIVAFLSDYLEGDTTLKSIIDNLANTKVDREEGKSLIDADYASSQAAIGNPEYLQVTTDSDNKTLEGIKPDGTKVVGGDLEVGGSATIGGDTKILGNMEVSGVSYKVVENPEYLAAWVDAENKVIFGLKTDGKTYVGDADFLNEIKNNQDAIVEIKPLIDKFFNGKKVSILGDSISTFNQKGYMIPGYAMYYPTATGDRGADVISVNDTWWMQVINSIGGVLEVNASASGSTASNRAIGFSPRVPLLGNPDIIYIALGTNDSSQAVPVGEINFNAQSYDLSQFAPAYIKGMQNTIAAYPKAKIICVAFDMGINYQNAIKTIAEHYGVEYIYVGDITDVHPNKAEMAAAANKISPAPQIYFENNPEFIEAKTDSEGKLLAGRTSDGAAFENVGFSTPSLVVAGIDITDNIEAIDSFTAIDDPEGRIKIDTDKENKIISYRDKNGVLHEEAGIETNSIVLSDNGLTDLEQALKMHGFNSGQGDWTDYLSEDGDKPLHLPIPRCAMMNLTNGTNDAIWPNAKFLDLQYYVQFWDMQGNYFKKKVFANAQGNSSLGMPKKNLALDFFDSEWDGDAFAVKFGNWVPQDSFHIKGYYADYFVGVCPIAYKFFDQFQSTRDIFTNRDWKKALLPSKEEIGYGCRAMDEEDDKYSLDNDARCFPDGFPVICFLNGNFYGVFSWQIKKHRDNYMMSKKKTKHIHLDGVISSESLFGANGDASLIKWTDVPHDTAFEVRNPKPKKKSDGWELTCADGTKYDGDTNMKELIGVDNVDVYDSTNTSHVKTNETKQAILTLSTYITELNQMETDSATSEEIKARMAEMFDVESFIDYIIFSDVVANQDGFVKNWQWITWDGLKWFVEPYDLDGIFGWTSWNEYSPLSSRLGNNLNVPSGWFIKYYSTELNARYTELRTKGVISTETIIDIFKDWIAAIGTDNYQRNHDMWPNDKEHYSPGPVETHYDNIYRVSNWIDVRISKCDEIYNYNQN